MDYSAFNPTVWLIFIGFCVVIWLAVKAFHAMHPGYPGYLDEKEDSKRIRMEVAV